MLKGRVKPLFVKTPEIRLALRKAKVFFDTLRALNTLAENTDDEIIKTHIKINALQVHSDQLEKEKNKLLDQYKILFAKNEN